MVNGCANGGKFHAEKIFHFAVRALIGHDATSSQHREPTGTRLGLPSKSGLGRRDQPIETETARAMPD